MFWGLTVCQESESSQGCFAGALVLKVLVHLRAFGIVLEFAARSALDIKDALGGVYDVRVGALAGRWLCVRIGGGGGGGVEIEHVL